MSLPPPSSGSKQLTIFGSTGGTGTDLSLAALNRGYTLVLFVRSPQKLRKELQEGKNVKVIVGNFEDKDKMKASVKGSIAILSTIGPPVGLASASPFSPDKTPIADANAFILSILEGDQKFISIATPTAFAQGDYRGLFWNLGVGFIRTFARPAWQEMVGIGKAFAESQNASQSVLVRVPLLSTNDSSAEVSQGKGVRVSSNVGTKGSYSKTGEDSGGVGIVLYREDLAEFMLDCVTTETWHGKWPHISSV